MKACSTSITHTHTSAEKKVVLSPKHTQSTRTVRRQRGQSKKCVFRSYVCIFVYVYYSCRKSADSYRVFSSVHKHPNANLECIKHPSFCLSCIRMCIQRKMAIHVLFSLSRWVSIDENNLLLGTRVLSS